MIIANGCPRSGTHALMAFLEHYRGLGRFPGILEAWHTGRTPILRLPNESERMISLQQAALIPDSVFVHGHVHAAVELPAGLRVFSIIRDPRNVLLSYSRWRSIEPLKALTSFCGRPFTEVYRGFLGWREHAEICFRYETLPVTPYYDQTETWSGAPSDWRKCWNAAIDEAWQSVGGDALVEEAGYA